MSPNCYASVKRKVPGSGALPHPFGPDKFSINGTGALQTLNVSRRYNPDEFTRPGVLQREGHSPQETKEPQ